MYCWFCKHPIHMPLVVRKISTDTRRINDHVAVCEQKVKCNLCRAEYTAEIWLDRQPNISVKQLNDLENKTRV